MNIKKKIIVCLLNAAAVAAVPGILCSAEGGQNKYIFEQLPQTFAFASGAGAWGTELTIDEDGAFSGNYHDSNMGDHGDGYDASCYISNFMGQFSEPEPINEYSYSMHLVNMEVEGTPGNEYIEDRIRFIYTAPYGLEHADEMILYGPGTPASEIREKIMPVIDLWNSDFAVLPEGYYGLYNVNEDLCFWGQTSYDQPERAVNAENEVNVEEAENAENPGDYIMADSVSRYLTEADIANCSIETIQLIVNEIYARHGRVFTMPENDQYFRTKVWYRPIEGKTDEQIVAEFNEYEKYNMEFLARYL